MNERTGNILMKKIFTEPANPEELYEFFTYGLVLNPLDYRLRWWPESTSNTIRRKVWYIKTTVHSESIIVDYQSGTRESNNSWYMYERKYLCQTFQS